MPGKNIIIWFFSITVVQAQVQPHALVISEIMADPTPSVGLPDAEFIEIYNRSNEVIDLGKVSFRNGSKTLDLPSLQMQPLSYMLICDFDDRDALEIYGEVIALESFPTLVNGGDDLALIDRASDVIIHEVVYDRSWYDDPGKDDGGWTLEIINPSETCASSTNWGSSISLIGGTPAAQNSISNLDSITPFAVLSIIPTEDQIELTFTKRLAPSLTKDLASLNAGAVPIIGIESIGLQKDGALILLAEALQVGTEYELTLSNLQDCKGQNLVDNTFQFVIPAKAEPGDLIINEVLFNPVSGGSDYIEVYNRSEKSILLSSLFIANLDDPSKIEKVQVERILTSGTYLVLTEDRRFVIDNYANVEVRNVLEMDLPSLPDKSGNVSLYRAEGSDRLVIDAFDYSEDYHLSLLQDNDGVSLERISHTASTNSPSNWQSASEVAGFGTPTAPNSQSVSNEFLTDMFRMSPRVFSPDGDGQDDFTLLQYSLRQAGIRIQVQIYDSAGRRVRDLANQVSLSVEGTLKWDGTSDSGSKLPVGIYTVLAKGFSENGDLLKWSETCVLANRL